VLEDVVYFYNDIRFNAVRELKHEFEMFLHGRLLCPWGMNTKYFSMVCLSSERTQGTERDPPNFEKFKLIYRSLQMMVEIKK
jgi:hypothetical protein